MAKYKQRSINTWRRRAAQGLRVATSAYRAYQRYSPVKKEFTSEPGVTNEYQVKTVYRRKRMPRWKKRKWVAFSKKTKAVIESQLATKTMLLNDAYDVANAANLQVYSAFMLYGLYGTDKNGFAGNSDIKRVLQNFMDNGTAVFKSAVLDITMVNKSAYPVEVDLYHVTMWKKNDDKNLDDSITRSVAETVVSGGTTALSLTTRGATPFDIPQIMRQTGMRILKKVKYFLGTGNCATYQIRDPRNRRFPMSQMPAGLATNEEYTQPGWTQGLLLVHKPVAGYQNQVATLSIGCTRKYAYCQLTSDIYEGGLDQVRVRG